MAAARATAEGGQAAERPFTLCLIRHGESLWNRANRFTGWVDIDLSDTGRQQATDAGRLLAARRYTFDVAYTSVLKRAIRTCWRLLDAMDLMHVPEHKTWRLNERNYGALAGHDKAETAMQYGSEQVHVWRRSFDVRPPPLRPSDPRYQAMAADPRYADLEAVAAEAEGGGGDEEEVEEVEEKEWRHAVVGAAESAAAGAAAKGDMASSHFQRPQLGSSADELQLPQRSAGDGDGATAAAAPAAGDTPPAAAAWSDVNASALAASGGGGGGGGASSQAHSGGHAGLRQRRHRVPLTESLKDTTERVLPYWRDVIEPVVRSGRRVLVAAHGNSLRAIVKHLDQISDQEIPLLEIPVGVPLIYELDRATLRPLRSFYLTEDTAAGATAVAAAAPAAAATAALEPAGAEAPGAEGGRNLEKGDGSGGAAVKAGAADWASAAAAERRMSQLLPPAGAPPDD